MAKAPKTPGGGGLAWGGLVDPRGVQWMPTTLLLGLGGANPAARGHTSPQTRLRLGLASSIAPGDNRFPPPATGTAALGRGMLLLPPQCSRGLSPHRHPTPGQ